MGNTGEGANNVSNDAIIHARREKVFRLREQGVPYRGIAEQLGVAVGTVHRDFELMLAERRNAMADDIESLRELEAARLDSQERSLNALRSQLTDRVIDGDGPKSNVNTKVAAILVRIQDSLTRLHARRAKLLGLDELADDLVKADDVRRAMIEYNTMIFDIIALFVPQDQHAALLSEMDKAMQASGNKIKCQPKAIESKSV